MDAVQHAAKISIQGSSESIETSEEDDESETNVFSIASKFPTDSNMPASCIYKDSVFGAADDDPKDSERLPEISQEKLKDLLTLLRQQLQTQNESDLIVNKLKIKNEEQEDELFKVREENCLLKQHNCQLESNI